MFIISHQLSKEYPAFTPLEVNDTPFEDVVKLYANVRAVQKREKKLSDPDRIIRRPAGNNWF